MSVPRASDRAPDRGWNHNTLYYPVVLGAVPPGCRRALDVGCGEGSLTRQLRGIVPSVVGIDAEEASIAAARAHPDADGIDYVLGDALACPLEPGSFDLVSAVASLHHMDAKTGLRRFASLLSPGGALVVIGCSRSTKRDYPAELAAIMTTFRYTTGPNGRPKRRSRLPSALWH